MLLKNVNYRNNHGTISGKFILTLFAIAIMLNLIILVGYTVYSKQSANLAYKERITTQLLDTLHLININPDQELQRIANVSKTENLSVTVAAKPEYTNKLALNSQVQLDDYLENIEIPFNISIQATTTQWLNFSFHPRNKAFIIQIIVISVETLMAIMLLFFVWYIERFTKPLEKFKKTAEHLGIHLTAAPIVAYGPPIVKETAEAMNMMQTRIMTLINDRTRMLAAISHDLRTPITRLKLQASMMTDQTQAKDMVTELDEMEQMIDQILVFTREANSQEPDNLIDIDALLMSLVDEKQDQGYQVEFRPDKTKARLTGKLIALKRAFVNILNNAVRYAKHVTVSTHVNDNQLQIIFEDDGPGIPENELEKVFSPFYRVDQSRSSQTGGAGLGLAITQDIVRHHHGQIHLENRANGGLRVLIIFTV